LICNFPAPSGNAPSLLDHQEVTTIFHEFGHALHAILTTVNYASLSGMNVPQDFVEAPSQMLEYFTWDKNVLDSFAADYRDPTKKIPSEILEKLKEADLATKASWYRRQLSFAIMDLKLHMPLTADQKANLNGYVNSVLNEVFLPSDSTSAMDTTRVTMVMPGQTRSQPIWRRSLKRLRTDFLTLPWDAGCAMKFTRSGTREM
jgi:Zn-dependent oligopeptidase